MNAGVEKPDAISDDRLYRGNEHYNEVIIHRSANCIIVAGPQRTQEYDPVSLTVIQNLYSLLF